MIIETRDGAISVRNIPEGSLSGDEDRVQLEVAWQHDVYTNIHITAAEALRVADALRNAAEAVRTRSAVAAGACPGRTPARAPERCQLPVGHDGSCKWRPG